jgi:hypothetical protein
MAPLQEKDVASMVKGLKAQPLLDGYRGADPVDMASFTRLVVGFSDLVMALSDRFDTIDLNPVICSSDRCVIADARIMLKDRRNQC